MEFITLRPLVMPLFRSDATAQGLQVINSVDTSVLKSNYYLQLAIASYYETYVDQLVDQLVDQPAIATDFYATVKISQL